MKLNHHIFDEQAVLHELKHYLPSQMPLKDFVHHNTLHAFQHYPFHEGLSVASKRFGYKTYLSLNEYRALYQSGKIKTQVLDHILETQKESSSINYWKHLLLEESFDTMLYARIGKLREHWKTVYNINLDKLIHPVLFRTVSAYLDQGIAVKQFPIHKDGFLASIRELEQNSFTGFFKSKRVKSLLLNKELSLKDLLEILVGDEGLFEQYLFDQQFAHPGWSGMISVLDNPFGSTLLESRKISLRGFITLELLLEIDALDNKFDRDWVPLGRNITLRPVAIFDEVPNTLLDEVYVLWQEAYEWSYYDEVLSGIQNNSVADNTLDAKSFQALFCIDDREGSLRRHVEQCDPKSETYGTPGFFNVEFFFQPEMSKFYTKVCPAPVTPRYLIKELGNKNRIRKDAHFSKHSHGLFWGWITSQTLGFVSIIKLMLGIFRPNVSATSVYSFHHTHKDSTLSILNEGELHREHGLQVGFTIEEMAIRVEGLLRSIGLVNNFAPIIYAVGHGASSVNNTHYAGYDCGACSGRPGSVNARVIAFMANHAEVRQILGAKGIDIPDTTQFMGAIHDTTRDEIEFFDENILTAKNKLLHEKNKLIFEQALHLNAKERSRRFLLTNTKQTAEKVHEEVKKRAVSMFEPRPELNHATNSLCIVGRRTLTEELFLDRRAFMNSYDYRVDSDGTYLQGILDAVAPVCGGINLEYYFSRVDNQKLGANTKLSHNVVGLLGVANGVDGDLRTGLPSQMIEIHDPLRLLVVVEHFPEIVLNAIQKNPATYEWFIHEWVFLVAIHPNSKVIYRFSEGTFKPYQPIRHDMLMTENMMALIEKSDENLPVFIMPTTEH